MSYLRPHLCRAGDTNCRWTLLSEVAPPPGVRGRYWLCRCTCGTERRIAQYRIRNGTAKSCGCLVAENARRLGATLKLTHGEAKEGKKTPEYLLYRGIISRCERVNNPHYKNYGGRGISMCKEWRESYPAFVAYVGRVPYSGATLDRWPNNNGNYEPGNVRWASRDQQSRNKRTNILLTFNGKTACLTDWATEMNVPSLYYRIKAGWPLEKALTTPTMSNAESAKLSHYGGIRQ